jgi:hypothetical protein
MPGKGRPFEPGHKFSLGGRSQARKDLTVELVTQLNSTLKDKSNVDRTRLSRVVRKLVEHATGEADDKFENGKLIEEGRGSLSAIIEVFDRLEGRPTQKVDVQNDAPREQRSLETVLLSLIESGLDPTRLPPPIKVLEHSKKDDDTDARANPARDDDR